MNDLKVTTRQAPYYTDAELEQWLHESDRSKVPVNGIIIHLLNSRALLRRLVGWAEGNRHMPSLSDLLPIIRDARRELEER